MVATTNWQPQVFYDRFLFAAALRVLYLWRNRQIKTLT
jgi:hypothetical protein